MNFLLIYSKVYDNSVRRLSVEIRIYQQAAVVYANLSLHTLGCFKFLNVYAISLKHLFLCVASKFS